MINTNHSSWQCVPEKESVPDCRVDNDLQLKSTCILLQAVLASRINSLIFFSLSPFLILSESKMTNILSWGVTLFILCVSVSVPVCVRGHSASVQRETRQISNALIQISSGTTAENSFSNKTVKEPVGSDAQTECLETCAAPERSCL